MVDGADKVSRRTFGKLAAFGLGAGAGLLAVPVLRTLTAPEGVGVQETELLLQSGFGTYEVAMLRSAGFKISADRRKRNVCIEGGSVYAMIDKGGAPEAMFENGALVLSALDNRVFARTIGTAPASLELTVLNRDKLDQKVNEYRIVFAPNATDRQ